MNAGLNRTEPADTQYLHADQAEQPSLLASPPVRIWLTLLLVIFGLGSLGGATQIVDAVATLDRGSLSGLFGALTAVTAMVAFSIGYAVSTPIPRTAIAGAPRPAPPAQFTSTTTAGSSETALIPARGDDCTEYFDVAAPQTHDGYAEGTAPMAYEASTQSAVAAQAGPRWFVALDNFLTRPVSRHTVIATVVATTTVCGLATWHWAGSVGETTSALVGVTLLSALFARITHIAPQSRQAVSHLRTTNNRLVQEIVNRRGRDHAAVQETGATEQWPLAMNIDSASLHDMEALRTKFLNEVSHELRGPITAINLAARIIMKHHEYDHGVVERFGSTIVVEGDRLAHIVNEFLELAKIESGCLLWSEDQIDPSDIVASAIFANEAAASERGIKLESEIDPKLKTMTADRDRIVQGITILVTAALRTATENGKLTIHARRGTTETLFAIEDDGSDPEDNKPFNIFGNRKKDKREDHAKDNSGHGLGLCVASEIAAHYGGEMWAEGREEQGTAFLLSIPDERPTLDVAAPATEPEPVEEINEPQVDLYKELEGTTPPTSDVMLPVFAPTADAATMLSVFAAGSGKAQACDSLGETPIPGPSETIVGPRPHAPSDDSSVGEMTDSLGAVGRAGEDRELAPWEQDFERPCASEQMTIREIDDLMYGRTGVFADDDGDPDEGSSQDDFDALEADSNQPTTEVPAETAACDALGAITDIVDVGDIAIVAELEDRPPSAFDTWLTEEETARQRERADKAPGDETAKSTVNLPPTGPHTPEALAAIAAGRTVTDCTDVSPASSTRLPAAHASVHATRKPHGAWRLAPRVGDAFVRGTAHRG